MTVETLSERRAVKIPGRAHRRERCKSRLFISSHFQGPQRAGPPSTLCQILEYHYKNLNKFSKVEFSKLFNQHNRNTVMAGTLSPLIPQYSEQIFIR